VTVLGTFLQNGKLADVFYREGYSDIEMEAGPYLSAIFEMYRPTRHPVNEIVNLYPINFDLGILHYASDTPLSKGKNLGAGALSYFGMDSTYASSVAILRRIFALEKARISGHLNSQVKTQ
jgi:membrane protease subunit (stomatin/prohibitin family)